MRWLTLLWLAGTPSLLGCEASVTGVPVSRPTGGATDMATTEEETSEVGSSTSPGPTSPSPITPTSTPPDTNTSPSPSPMPSPSTPTPPGPSPSNPLDLSGVTATLPSGFAADGKSARRNLNFYPFADDADVDEYRSLFGDTVTSCDVMAAGWSSWTGIATPLELDMPTVGANYRLCVQGRASAAAAETGILDKSWTRVQRGRITPANIVKVSIDAPIITPPAPGAGCGQYLFDAFDSLWFGTSVSNGTRVYFFTPCKYNDSGTGGRHLMISEWDYASAAGSHLDKDPATAGIQQWISRAEFVSHFSGSYSGEGDVRAQFPAFDDDGKLHGLGMVRHTGHVPANIFPFTANSIADLVVSSYDESKKDKLYDLVSASDPWRASIEPHRGSRLMSQSDGSFVFFTVGVAPDATRSIIRADVDATLAVFTNPRQIVSGASRPQVARYGNSWYLVYLDETLHEWRLATSQDGGATFDTANSQALGLESLKGALAKWDSFYYTGASASDADQPLISGIETFGDELFIFYRAGKEGFESTSPPYDVPRSIGAFKVAIEPF